MYCLSEQYYRKDNVHIVVLINLCKHYPLGALGGKVVRKGIFSRGIFSLESEGTFLKKNINLPRTFEQLARSFDTGRNSDRYPVTFYTGNQKACIYYYLFISYQVSYNAYV